MKQFVQFCAVALSTFSMLSASAQLNPTISGDNMLCPEGTGTLTTQQFGSYQWYRRYYGAANTDPIAGETNQTLTMDYYNYAASYLSVVVTSGPQADTSAEFFVDGWAFIGMTVMSEGDFTIGPNGETIICEGDTMYFTVMQPYDTNIQWYENGQPIAGANSTVFTVTEAGIYNVEGAPAVCPNYMNNPGVDLVVQVENCSGAGLSDPEIPAAQLYPVPAQEELTIKNEAHLIREVYITNQLGQLIFTSEPNAFNTLISTENFQSGYYFITIHYNEGEEIQSFIVE